MALLSPEHPRLYPYVGPPEHFDPLAHPHRWPIKIQGDLLQFFEDNAAQTNRWGVLAATYIIDRDLCLYLADRRSEHVACARGAEVAAAGEMFFEMEKGAVRLERVSNQSTGYCPALHCWAIVVEVLGAIGLEATGFDPACEFRRCDACGNIQIVKDWAFDCLICSAPLSAEWNVALPPREEN